MPSPDSGLQRCTTLSFPQEATVLPSGANATPQTSAVCPLNVARLEPDSASHTQAVLSALADASHRPSGLYAIPATQFEWALIVRTGSSLFGSQIRIVPSAPPEARD